MKKRSIDETVIIRNVLCLVVMLCLFITDFKLIPITSSAEALERWQDFGTHGRFDIPSLEIQEPLYVTNYEKNQTPQDVVDAKYSACLLCWGKTIVIADHVSSGNMYRLKDAEPGEIGYIYQFDGSYNMYECIEVTDAKIVHPKNEDGTYGSEMYYLDETPVYGNLNCDLVVYTCHMVQPYADLGPHHTTLVTFTRWVLRASVQSQ